MYILGELASSVDGVQVVGTFTNPTSNTDFLVDETLLEISEDEAEINWNNCVRPIGNCKFH